MAGARLKGQHGNKGHAAVSTTQLLVLIASLSMLLAPSAGAAPALDRLLGPQLGPEPPRLASPSQAQAAGEPSAENGAIIPNHYIVVLEDSVAHPGALAESQTEGHDGELGFVYRYGMKGYSAELSHQAVEELRDNPKVKYVTPDRVVTTQSQTIPTGIQRAFDTANEGVAIDEGDNMRVNADVAVIDVGVDQENPELDVVARTNCVPADGNPVTSECVDGTGDAVNGHGTHVGGTIGAIDNGEGVVGVAPGARLWSVKTLNDQGIGSVSWIIAGIEWVTRHASQIEVANMSLGAGGKNLAIEEAIEASAEAGVVYTLAAGNSAADVKEFFPAGNPDAITVSALADYDGKPGGEGSPTCTNGGPDDTLATFSNYGEGVNVAAPGVCILSTLPGGGYGSLSGTSMAAPHVAGAAAILASQHNPEDLKDVEAIRQTIEEEGSQAWQDTSGDGVQEPLLDVANEATFAPTDQVAVTAKATTHSPTEVTLNGLVNPGGGETEYYFEYGSTLPYGSKAPVSAVSAGSGTEYVPVHQTITEVEGHTLYHYRLVAVNSEGSFFGADQTFATTPPTVSVRPATGVGANSATLNATVNPESFDTTYRFEYGLSTSYGVSVKLPPLSAGTEAIEVMTELEGLRAEATYHFRVVATNTAGTTYGEDETFTTQPADWVVQATPERHQEEMEEEDVSNTEQGQFRVSCSTPSDCMAVGYTNIHHSTRTPPWVRYPEALRWDGKTWTHTDLPVPVGIERDNSFMFGVSCATPTSCFALGVDYYRTGEQHTFVDHWDGEQWTAQLLPTPVEGSEFISPKEISCGSPDSCMAFSEYQVDTGRAKVIQVWNGDKWSVAPLPPAPKGSDEPDVRTVSCPEANACVAIGSSSGATWNGKTWSVTPISFPSELSLNAIEPGGLSCTAVDVCIAAGTGWGLDGSQKGLFAAHWDGEEWTIEDMPEPKNYVWLGGARGRISCSSANDCEFVTIVITSNLVKDNHQWNLVEHWNGEQWSIQTMVNASWPFSYPLGLSCVQGHCTAAGYEAPLQRLRSSPVASTEAATALTTGSATLNGTVNPEGFSTEYHFEWSSQAEFENGGYAHSTAAKTVGSGTAGIEASEPIEGLSASGAYHFRIVATNSIGTAYGADMLTAPKATTEAASGIVEQGATLNGTVNPQGSATNYWFEWGKGETLLFVSEAKSAGSGSADVVVSEKVGGLKAGTVYHFRVVAENAEGTKTYGELKEFKTPAPPKATTEVATGIEEQWATLNGKVNPEGSATNYWFEWGKGETLLFVSEAKSAGSGSADVAVSEKVGVLKAGTVYHFRVVAENAEGTKTYGELKEFKTLKAPKAITEAATEVKEISAKLNGTVNPEGTSTSYYFEYGESTAYGTKTEAQSAGSGTTNVAVNKALSSLKAGATYHFRVVAEGASTVKGEDKEFTTTNPSSEINTLPTLDALNRSETPLSNSGKWSALAWDTSTSGHNTGYDTITGWGAYDASPIVNGAYWSPASFSDKTGDAAAATMAAAPTAEGRYLALWLDMGSPGSSKSGYQLRWTYNSGTTYTVKLCKWSAGKETLLASNSSVSIAAGTTMAISDTGGTVTAWQGSSGSLSSILSASDTAFGEGYAGIEVSGQKSRLTNFKAGVLLGNAIAGVPIRDEFNREEVPLATGKWTKTSWAEEIGGSWGSPFHGYGAKNKSETVAGAYWNGTSFSDSNGAVVASGTIGSEAGGEGSHLSLWLDMPNPGSVQSGYMATAAQLGETAEYTVLLYRLDAGKYTLLGYAPELSLPVGTTLALSETGGSLAVWSGTSTLTPIVSAADTTYSSGYVGIDSSTPNGGPNGTTMYDFRAGNVS